MNSKQFSLPLLPCPICDETGIDTSPLQCKDYISGDFFSLLLCKNCQSYITSISHPSENTNYYGENYYNSSSGKFSGVVERLFRYNHKRNAKFFNRHFPAERILEIGCGRGYILKELKKLGSDVYCLESAKAADWILNNQDIHIVAFDESKKSCWPFEQNFFQLIIFWHVLEHIQDPGESLHEATRCLSPGGVLCISVPNISSLQAQLGRTTWFHLDVPRHLFHFSRKGLISFLERNGYQIINISAGDRIQNLFGWFQSAANLFTPWATNSLYRLLQAGKPLRTSNLPALFIQLMTFWIWIPLAITGFLLEEITKNYGTITVYAKKPPR